MFYCFEQAAQRAEGQGQIVASLPVSRIAGKLLLAGFCRLVELVQRIVGSGQQGIHTGVNWCAFENLLEELNGLFMFALALANKTQPFQNVGIAR